ncbi:MAG: MMPL family transporter [Proteobacteria bacterium]|nr:MMPL family transporter [Pseudomonadota bacterium]
MLDRLLRRFKQLALNRRKTVITVTLLATCIMGYLAGTIGVDMKWVTLLPQSEPAVKEWIEVLENYPMGSNYMIVVESEDPVLTERAVEETTERVEALTDVVTATYGKLDERFLIQHGLRSIKPKDLRRSVDVFSNPALVPYLTHLNDDFEKEFSGDAEKVQDQERELTATMAALEDFVLMLDDAAGGAEIEKSRILRTVRDLSSGNPYFLSLDKKMGIIPVAVKASSTDWGKQVHVDERIRPVLREIEKDMPGIRIGTTGMIPTARDELESMGPYTFVLTLAALVLIFTVLVWNFRSLVIPILGMTPIIIGIIWSMGFYRLTIQDLNIMTAMIMLVLIGLGIDFSIHVITRFYEERSSGHSLDAALEKSVVVTGRGVLAGALTTALAFFALMVGDTKGIVEFGFCAGSGIVISLLAIFFILPTLLVLRDNRLTRKGKAIESRDFVFLGNLASRVTKRRRLSFVAALILIVVAVMQLGNLKYEYNLLELEPAGLESVRLQKEIIDRYKMSAELAFTTVETVEEARAISKRLKKKKTVGDVDAIHRWIPAPDWIEQNDESIRTLRARLAESTGSNSFSEQSQASRKRLGEEIQRLLYNLIELEELSFIGGQDRVVAAIERVTGGEAQNGILVKLIDHFKSGSITWKRIDEFADTFSGSLKFRLERMVEYEGPVTEQMLPEKLQALYRNPDSGRYLVQIYPKKNLYEYDPLIRFVDSVSSVSDRISGTPKLLLLINEAMVRDGKKALIAAALVIILLLVLDMRNLTAAFTATIPLFFGALWMVAMMAVLGIKLNFVNIIAVPVIIGIGVDNGIHILHRWRQEGVGGVRQAATKVGHAILMTSITTMIGFGSIAFYTHRGMASLGYVLFLGVGFCFISTIIVLPLMGSFVEKRLMKKFNPLQSGNNEAVSRS